MHTDSSPTLRFEKETTDEEHLDLSTGSLDSFLKETCNDVENLDLSMSTVSRLKETSTADEEHLGLSMSTVSFLKETTDVILPTRVTFKGEATDGENLGLSTSTLPPAQAWQDDHRSKSFKALLRKSEVQWLEEQEKDHEEDDKIRLFDFHKALLAKNLLLPVEVVNSLFREADDDNDGAISDDDLSTFLIALRLNYVHSYDDDDDYGDNNDDDTREKYNNKGKYNKIDHTKDFDLTKKHLVILNDLVHDTDFLLKFLWVIAGVLLTIAAFSGDKIPAPILRSMYIGQSACYLINGMIFCISFPYQRWNEEKKIQIMTQQFKEAIRSDAQMIYEINENNGVGQFDFKNIIPTCMRGASLVLYDGFKVWLSKRDLEMLLIKTLGDHDNSSKLLDTIWNDLNVDRKGAIPANMLRAYIETDKEKERPKSSLFFSTFFLFFFLQATLFNIDWILTSCFVFGPSLSILMNILSFFGETLTNNDAQLQVVTAWIITFACLSFTHQSYTRKVIAASRKARAKLILADFIVTSDAHQDSGNTSLSKSVTLQRNPSGRSLNDGGCGLNKVELHSIFQRYSVFLAEKEIDIMFHKINVDHNGVIYKSEIEEFVEKEVRQYKILPLSLKCLTSFDFWANNTWFLGSIGYVIAAYNPNGTLALICTRVSRYQQCIDKLSML